MDFYDETSGATLKMDRYYGFGDAGGLAGSFDGYESANDCAKAIALEGTSLNEMSLDPSKLGEVSVCILTGQQFVDRLATLDDISEFGHFVE